ncbi:MAG: hypothetical protein LBF38_01555 [Deltaproteobacteria bacterium]|nr:hypothetical protein [Deltaproteobacteria bacterium]
MAQTYPNLTGGVPPQTPSTSNRYVVPLLAIGAVVVIMIVVFSLSAVNNPIIGDWMISPRSNFFVNLLTLGSISNVRIKITKNKMILVSPFETKSEDIRFEHVDGRWYIINGGERSEIAILDENTITIKSDAPLALGGLTLERVQPNN